MDTSPFCVFKCSNHPYYFVLFKDDVGNYVNKPISTKRKTKKEAEKVAFQWLRDGIPQKTVSVRVQDLSLRDMAKKIASKGETDKLLSELQKMGLMKTYILNDTPQAEDFVSFLFTFWSWESSGEKYERGKRKFPKCGCPPKSRKQRTSS